MIKIWAKSKSCIHKNIRSSTAMHVPFGKNVLYIQDSILNLWGRWENKFVYIFNLNAVGKNPKQQLLWQLLILVINLVVITNNYTRLLNSKRGFQTQWIVNFKVRRQFCKNTVLNNFVSKLTIIFNCLYKNSKEQVLSKKAIIYLVIVTNNATSGSIMWRSIVFGWSVFCATLVNQIHSKVHFNSYCTKL